MKCSACPKASNAFTLLEVFILVVVLAILSLILLPALRPAHFCCQLNCSNNLKQIGLAFKTWALDNGDRFPMGVSTNDGGTLELCSGPNAFAHFAVMSNELSTPKVLVCPQDTSRQWATNFQADLDDSKVSYFVGLNVGPTNLTMLLSGDRNLTNDSPTLNSVLTVRPNDNVRWTDAIHKKRGVILLADGSVQEVLNGSFRTFLQGAETNWLAMP